MGDVVEKVKGFAAAHGLAGEKVEVVVSKVLLETAEAMGDALASAPIFLRDGRPVVVCPEQHRIEEVGTDEFITFVDAFVKVVTMKKIQGDGPDDFTWVAVRGSLTKATAATILASKAFRGRLRPLRKMALVRLPVRRESGKIELLPEGYDAESGIFTVDTLGGYEEWGLADAQLELEDLLGLFPFVKDSRKDGTLVERALAGQVLSMLNLFCANLLPRWCSRPAFVANANTQKTGKSLLVKMALAPVTGTQVATTLPARRDGTRLKEMLNTAALGAAPYLFFDNCEGLVEAPELAAFIQAPQWGDRRFREQTDFIAENVTTVYLTGVDFSVGADMAQRCVFVDLFVEEGDASRRQIGREIDETWLMQTSNRRRILSAMWALVKHWAELPEEDRPKVQTWLPGFRAYAETMGSIVMAAGFVDPFSRAPSGAVLDKEQRDFLTLLAELVENGGEEFTFPQILEVCRVRGLFDWFVPAYDSPDENADLDLGNVGVDANVEQRVKVKLGKLLGKRSEGSAVRSADGEATGRVYVLGGEGEEKRVRFRALGSSSARSRRYGVTVEA